MRNLKVVLGAIAITLSLASCKDEAKMTAERNVDHYVVYVDSIDRLDSNDRVVNWDAIEAEYNAKMSEAEANMEKLDEKAKERYNEAKAKYDQIKNDAKESMNSNSGSDTLAATFFGPGNVVGNDMSFAWVNKDNILSVYQNFFETFKSNKDSYSRQDLDKIKAWYEALDARKNTVEKEGLTSEDNNKIAEIKVKFAPMFKWERITAKGEENEDAKEAAE
ncbi:hypothetical protein [Flavobacterium rhizosphaerae]|uniref:Lipoprotein n=1 Tax=Flavobacterium rhizosphaerae TaxID=3163298 RepID=A0ABW8YYV7_9FLAO